MSDAPGSWLILTTGGFRPKEHGGSLIRVDTNGKFERLAQPASLALGVGIFPNSLVKLRDGTLYAGARHFVLRLTPAGGSYREDLLLPKDRPQFDYEPWIDAPDAHRSVTNCTKP